MECTFFMPLAVRLVPPWDCKIHVLCCVLDRYISQDSLKKHNQERKRERELEREREREVGKKEREI
jgi:hypothetical protein